MKIAITGLPGSGRSTIASALNGGELPAGKGSSAIITARVPDPRVDRLSEMYKPKKTTYAQVEYLVPTAAGDKGPESFWNEARNADALIQVVRNFVNGAPPDAAADVKKLASDMAFADYSVLEKRIERLDHEKGRGKKVVEDEYAVVADAKLALEGERPLRDIPEIADSPILRGFGLLTAKPVLYLLNNEETDGDLPGLAGVPSEDCMAVRGMIESEIAGMDETEAAEFLSEYGITESALSRIIRRSYRMLGLASFFTVGEDEVKAWTVREGEAAVDAADVIHSDIRKGFIRAEVVHYDDLMAAGSHAEAKKQAKVRLEGKTYPVTDGDIINFRFNV